MVTVLVSVGHTSHEALAVFRFRTDRYFSQPVLTQRFDDDSPLFPACDEHGVGLFIDDIQQLMGNQNCDADLYIHGNHPFVYNLS